MSVKKVLWLYIAAVGSDMACCQSRPKNSARLQLLCANSKHRMFSWDWCSRNNHFAGLSEGTIVESGSEQVVVNEWRKLRQCCSNPVGGMRMPFLHQRGFPHAACLMSV